MSSKGCSKEATRSQREKKLGSGAWVQVKDVCRRQREELKFSGQPLPAPLSSPGPVMAPKPVAQF